MSIWRFTGNPENWITAVSKEQWALNEHNRGLWDNKIKPNDTVIFHSTRNSDYDVDTPSSIIGFAFIGEGKYIKSENWWIQETNENKNFWPYVVPLKEIYLFTGSDKIDFNTPIQNKTTEQIIYEINELVKNCLTISDLNAEAKKINPDAPNFPVNGSASGVNEIYENLILSDQRDVFLNRAGKETSILEEKISENLDEKLSHLDKNAIFQEAKKFDNSEVPSHSTTQGTKRVRKENQLQKRRIAHIEDFSCQICGFKYPYTRISGKQGWIYEVDHITEKADGGNENMDNLWILCPNCHSKKTRGVIVVDKENGTVKENGTKIELHHDSHLGW